MPSLRLFIAIETPPDIRPKISAIRDKLGEAKADVKWEPDEKLHVTLKFLGEKEERLLPDIVSSLEGVGRKSASLFLTYKGIGCFPNRRAPRVIWTGMEDLKGNMNLVQQEIESAVFSLGVEREERKFHAHVTLGRVRSEKRIQSLLRMMESITFESQPVEIREVALIKSELKPSGSVYTTLKTIPLCT